VKKSLRPANAYLTIEVVFKVHLNQELADHQSTLPYDAGEPLAPSAKSFLYPFSSNEALPSSE